MTFTKIFILLGVLLLANAYTEENHVLILTADDFPNILTEFPQILIEFYAPWCGHCKKLTPIYDQVAKTLHEAGSPVRLAKIDADQHSSVKGTYEVRGFPTLIYFSNSQQIKYNGQRTKEFMVNWLNKKTRPAVTELEASQLEELSTNGKVNIVFHGDIASHEHGNLFKELATADDYNTYYSIQGTEQAAGTVQILRPFGEPVSTQIDSSIKSWISNNERPVVFAFDDRTIGDIFGERSIGVILFQSAEAGEALNDAFAEAAQKVRIEQGKSLIFTSIETSAEHYGGLSNYIKIITNKSPIAVIDGGKRVKYVLSAKPSDITADEIVSFVDSVTSGKAKEYKIDEEVVYSDDTKVEDEL